MKDMLRRLAADDCRAAVLAAIEQADDGAGARRIIAERLELVAVS